MIPVDKQAVGSFSIDHTKLKPGIYTARVGQVYKTFDVRMTAPNVEPAMAPGGYHSLEHLMATFVRNVPGIKDDVIAMDAMACNTGFYLIMQTTARDYNEQDIREIMINCMDWILEQTEVPATTEATCGNCYLHNINDAKYYARKYKNDLINNFCTEYTKLQVVLADGRVFQDS
jgi:S-ribosylhomocysteine lyase